MDKHLILNQFMTKEIILKTRNKELLYGTIIGFHPEPFNKMDRWLFLQNLDKEQYHKTEDKSLLVEIYHPDIISIDYKIP